MAGQVLSLERARGLRRPEGPLVELADGRHVLLRPARAVDGPKLAAFHDGLSDRSQAFSLISGDALPDGDCWVAEGDGGRLVAVAVFRLDPEGRARAAFTVRDDHQDVGLGTALFRRVLAAASRRGGTALTASVLPTNEPMLRLSRRFGAEVTHRDGGEVLVVLPLCTA